MHLALGCKYLLLDSHRLYFSIKVLQSLLYLIDLNSLDLELFIEELFLRNIGSPYFYEFMILKNTDTSLKAVDRPVIQPDYALVLFTCRICIVPVFPFAFLYQYLKTTSEKV